MSAESRPRIKYAGKPRARINRKTGDLEACGQRQFSRPSNAIVWTMGDQHAAIDAGFFLQRSAPRNAVWVRPVSVERTDSAICNELERLAFSGDRHALKALIFIEQQDRYGWSGAWDKPVIEIMGQLRWYKDREQSTRKSYVATREHFKALASKRWSNSKHT